MLIPLKFKYRNPLFASSNVGHKSTSANKGGMKRKRIWTLVSEGYRKRYGGKK